jgi:diguanylate cyclase (GGDEF)-like protein
LFETQLRIRSLAYAGAASAVIAVLVFAYSLGWPPSLPSAGSLVMLGVVVIASAAAVFAAAHYTIAPVVVAVEKITDFVRPRRDGDVPPPIPRAVRRTLPKLTAAIELFKKRIQTNIDTIQQTALQDPVTDLPNRLSFRRTVERHLRSMTRREGAKSAILFIDLDRFKSVNDSLGHAQGDVLLAMFAARMRVLLSAESNRRGAACGEALLARLAGDEFTVLLPDVAGPADATKLARQILRAMQEPFEFAGQSIVIGASIGICIAPDDGDTYETLTRNADTAMYYAKDSGRNQYHLFEAAMHERVRDRLQLESMLRAAIAGGQFELHMQPQINAESGKLVSAEALIRWRHPDKSLRAPASFIDIAEDSGLIVDVGRWVIAEAARIVGEWHARGDRLRLSINVSPQQVERTDFVRHVRTCIEAANAPPEMLEIEITESTVMSSDPVIVDRLAEVRALGISIAIDDFGTGYSNLARLKDLPIDRLKIDRSLVKDVATSADSRTIIQAIVSLAAGLGYECVAEGVETEIQADILSVIGCETLQGYWISKPIPLAEFETWRDAHEPEHLGAAL